MEGWKEPDSKMSKKQQNRRENNRSEQHRTTLIIGVMLLVALFSVSFVSAITWDNVAYYKLDEATGDAIDIISGNNGTVVGATQGATGKINTAYYFDGSNDYVNTPFNLPTGNNFTISYWQKAQTTISNLQCPIAQSSGVADNQIAFQYLSHDAPFLCLAGPPLVRNIEDVLNTNTTWLHIVWVNDVGTNTIYVNGVLSRTRTVASGPSYGSYENTFSWAGLSTSNAGLEIGLNEMNSRYFNGIVDEVGIWGRALSPAEVADLWNDGAGLPYNRSLSKVTLISPLNNTITSIRGINFTAEYFCGYSVPLTYNLINATYYVWSSTGIFNNSVVVEITGTENSTTENINGLVLGDYEWNVYACHGNTTFSSCTFADSNYSFTFIPFSVTNEEHNSTALETSLQEFKLTITTNEGYTIQNGRLVYNGTVYPFADKTDLGAGSFYLTKSIYIPGGVAGFGSENRTFYWNLTIVNEATGTSSYEETGEYGQNVTELKFGLCGGELNIPMLNFTLYDEETGTQINSTANLTTFQATFNLGGSYQLLKSYSINNLTVNKSEYDFCTDNENNTISADMELFYTAEGYTDKDYFLNNATLTNNTNEISLYLLSEATALEFFISVERNLVPLPYVTVNIEKYFVGEGVYKTVEIDETGVDGEFTAYLDLDKKYRFKVYENGVLLSSQEKRATCDAAPCTIELTITKEHEVMMSGYYESYASNVLYNLSYDGGTTVVTFDFIDTTGTTNYFVMYIYQGKTNQSSQVIYNKTVYTSSGTMTYNFTEHGYTTGDFTVKVYVSRSPESFIDFLTVVLNVMAEQLGLLGLFTSLILILVIIFGFAFKPSLLIMSVPLTMTIMKLMGFISLSTIGIISIYILGGIAVASLSR